MVLGLIHSCAATHTAGLLCSNTCTTGNQGLCDDGEPGAWFSNCALGTDCADCGPRGYHPPPPQPRTPPSPASPRSPPRPPLAPNSTLLCSNTCTSTVDQQYGFSNWCDDGGPGATLSECSFGTDCDHCGARVVYPPPPPTPAGAINRCTYTCNWNGDSDCDDGGPGSEFSQCALGTDCYDCGPRLLVPPVGTFFRCEDTCTVPMYYGNCDDGGEGSGWSWCDLGTDCFSCGLRAIPFAPPPPPPPPLSATPPPPPPAPAVGPEIVVDFDSSPNDCRWALACSDGYSYPNGIMPQRVRPSPPLVPGSTCTLTLKAYWGWGWYNGKWTYDALEFTNPYDPDQSGPRVETNYTFIVPEAPPSPSPPNLPPVAPIAYDSGFAVVLPQLIITYKFFNFSTACTASSTTGCTPGTGAPKPSVVGTRTWEHPRNTLKLVAETSTQMGCSGRPRCKVDVELTNGGITPAGRRLQASNANTLIIKATVTWTDVTRVRNCPPVAPSSPPSPPSTPPPPPPPLPMATSSEISVEMIALGMGLYHERYFFNRRSPPPRPPPPHE